jgi:hypothetical protein
LDFITSRYFAVKSRRSAHLPEPNAAEEAELGETATAPRPAAVGQHPGGLRLPQTTRAAAKLLELDPGLYAMKIGALRGPATEISGLTLPAVQISVPPIAGRDAVEIVATSGEPGGWLGMGGGAVVLKSPDSGGHVLITTFLPPNQADMPLAIEINRLDEPGPRAAPVDAPAAMPAAETSEAPPARRAGVPEVRTEIMLHVEREGDRLFPGGDWVGHRGAKLRIEGFSIRPVERLSPADIEFKAYGPSGRETPWVSDGKLCGTRGRRLPLTGFAIRPATHLQDQYDVIYQGSFFAGGTSGPFRNGEACLSSIADDPLEALNVHLVERRPTRA